MPFNRSAQLNADHKYNRIPQYFPELLKMSNFADLDGIRSLSTKKVVDAEIDSLSCQS